MTIQEKVKQYLLNPNKCKYCNSEIKLVGFKIAVTKAKQFCNHTCNGLYQGKNNKILGKKRILKNSAKKYYCTCGKEKERKSNICKECFSKSDDRFLNRSKQLVLDSYKNIEKGFIAIRKNSRYIYNNSNRLKECLICGYNKHYEICHIKGIKEFNNNSLIKEINDIDNLIALCRNHHWELDNKILKL